MQKFRGGLEALRNLTNFAARRTLSIEEERKQSEQFVSNTIGEVFREVPLLNTMMLGLDRGTRLHSFRTATAVDMVLKGMNSVSPEEREITVIAAFFHDIGKQYVLGTKPQDIALGKTFLHLPRPYTQDEHLVMKAHPYIGSEIITEVALKPETSPVLKTKLFQAAELIAGHHEVIIPLGATDYDGRTIQHYLRNYSRRLIYAKYEDNTQKSYEQELRLLRLRTAMQQADLFEALYLHPRNYNGYTARSLGDIKKLVTNRYSREMVYQALEQGALSYVVSKEERQESIPAIDVRRVASEVSSVIDAVTRRTFKALPRIALVGGTFHDNAADQEWHVPVESSAIDTLAARAWNTAKARISVPFPQYPQLVDQARQAVALI